MNMRVTATPAEIRDWQEFLAPLSPDRAQAAMRLLAEVVGDCPTCQGPIRRSDRRRLVEDRLYHRGCAPVPLRSPRQVALHPTHHHQGDDP